jgi:hypothetical protein
MTVAANATLRAVWQMLLPDSVILQNVFYTLFEADGTSDDEADVVLDLVEWMETIFTNLVSGMDSDVIVQEMIAYVRDVAGGDWDEIGTGVPDITPTGAGSMAPHGVAALQHARSTDPDVSGHKYFGGLPDDSVTDSDLSGGLITAIVLAGADWVTAFTGTDTASGFIPGVWSPTNLAFFPFNGVFVTNGQVAYQRRRKPGVGI